MRTLSRLIASLVVALACAACNPGAGGKTEGAPAPLAKPATPEELRVLAKSDNAFALDFYGRIRARKGNLVFSPFSIFTALTMTWAGARGETAAQMAKVLHLDGPGERTLDLAGAQIAGYGAPGQKVTLRVANRLFGEKTFAFEKPYLDRIQRSLGAPLEPLDFRGAPEAARGRINGWVAGQTNNRITGLIPPSGVDGNTRLVLTNAIYFLGEWATQFKKDLTRPEPFFSTPGAPHDVPTMHVHDHFRFAATDGVSILEMAYQGGALAMTFVLPDAVDGLGAVEARLSPAVFDAWMAAAGPSEVVVSLPKLSMAPAEPLSLAPLLSELGMPLAFGGEADLTAIANPPNPSERLFVANVYHKAFLELDEKGTEAAAATAVAVAAAPAAAPPVSVFKADHPFLFFLRDTRSGLVLFMGRVTDPGEK